MMGYLTAPDGNFDTPYLGLNLAYVMEIFAQDQKGAPLVETDPIKTNKWRLSRTPMVFDAQRKGGSSRICNFWEVKLIIW